MISLKEHEEIGNFLTNRNISAWSTRDMSEVSCHHLNLLQRSIQVKRRIHPMNSDRYQLVSESYVYRIYIILIPDPLSGLVFTSTPIH